MNRLYMILWSVWAISFVFVLVRLAKEDSNGERQHGKVIPDKIKMCYNPVTPTQINLKCKSAIVYEVLDDSMVDPKYDCCSVGNKANIKLCCESGQFSPHQVYIVEAYASSTESFSPHKKANQIVKNILFDSYFWLFFLSCFAIILITDCYNEIHRDFAQMIAEIDLQYNEFILFGSCIIIIYFLGQLFLIIFR